MDGAVVIAPKSPPSPQEPLKKKRKLMSNAPTAIIDLTPKALLPVTTDKDILLGNNQPKPAEWGLDAHIATPYQKCNKCMKLDIPCIVLLDKSLDAHNLVKKRMQAKATMALSHFAKHSGMHILMSQVSGVKLYLAKEVEQQPGLPAGMQMQTLTNISTS
ncbi:hypothetical protein BDR06DRAFT_1015699 [Suillus hirtellus]|nr:hypothetical protein BDR06DRAFT_1015699 [Suillus hirtellus]